MAEWWQDLFDEKYVTLFAEARGPLHTAQEVEALTTLLTTHGAPDGGQILDLACGLNPIALPFMGLPHDVDYYAYDIHQPRIGLINDFFTSQAIQPLAEVRDVLLNPPQISAGAAFLFKEAHRMEKRRKGCSRELVKAIDAKVTFISLPNRSLDGQRDLHQRMDNLFEQISAGLPGETGRREFPGETLYWIRKTDG